MTRSALLLLADSRFPAGAHAHSGGLEAAAAAGRVHDTASLHEFLSGRLHTGALLAAAFAAAACQADQVETLAELDHEHDVRLLSPALRLSSRRLGRQLLRAARATWPGPRLDLLADLVPAPGTDAVAEQSAGLSGAAAAESSTGASGVVAAESSAGPSGAEAAAEPAPKLSAEGPHHPITLGVVCASAGLTVEDAAACAVQSTLAVPAHAAIGLLGLDPYEVAGVLARLAPGADRVAARALTLARMAALRNDFGLLPALGAPLLDLAAEDHATWEVRRYAT
jgi:urease accessory protein